MSRSTAYKKRRRANLFAEQGGLCYWCAKPMTLAKGPVGGRITDDSFATIDHVYGRAEMERNSYNTRWVLACYACNQRRARDQDPQRRGFARGFVRRSSSPIVSEALGTPFLVGSVI